MPSTVDRWTSTFRRDWSWTTGCGADPENSAGQDQAVRGKPWPVTGRCV